MQLCVFEHACDAHVTTEGLAPSWCSSESVSCILLLMHKQLPCAASADSFECAEAGQMQLCVQHACDAHIATATLAAIWCCVEGVS